MYDIVLTCNHFTHKLILVTGVDRLEKDLTTGQMQGTLKSVADKKFEHQFFDKNSP